MGIELNRSSAIESFSILFPHRLREFIICNMSDCQGLQLGEIFARFNARTKNDHTKISKIIKGYRHLVGNSITAVGHTMSHDMKPSWDQTNNSIRGVVKKSPDTEIVQYFCEYVNELNIVNQGFEWNYCFRVPGCSGEINNPDSNCCKELTENGHHMHSVEGPESVLLLVEDWSQLRCRGKHRDQSKQDQWRHYRSLLVTS
jgi:hypothetical protein